MRTESSNVARSLILVAAVVVLPVTGYAQEALLSGTVTDSTGGVLPGVTVTALHEVSGNTFVAVTDERGAYRLSVRIGVYAVTANLDGFSPLGRRVELLVGQNVVMNFELSPSAVEVSVTVSGEAPLVDTRRSSLGSNIDPRQMESLPLNGRNWADLAMLAVGSRQVESGALPGGTGAFQINLDGQQVTNIGVPFFGQARYSRDSIAEFQFIANRFDATQGRSSGVQVNAVTKSGTNVFSGTFGGYFRDDEFNDADFIQNRVLPASDQQLSGTFGGPIRKDKIHFFGNYEYEREPKTFSFSTPFPSFNLDLTDTHTVSTGGARVDFQFSPGTRVTTRFAASSDFQPCDRSLGGCAGGTITPAASNTRDIDTVDFVVTLTQALSNRAVNELRGGYNALDTSLINRTQWVSGNPALRGRGAPQITFTSFRAGQSYPNTPNVLDQKNYSIRDNFTYSFEKAGSHTLQLGGDFLHMRFDNFWCLACSGIIDAQGGPTPDNLEEIFPNVRNPSTWNLAAISPITRSFAQGIGEFAVPNSREVFAGWVQEDWQVNPRLTLNLGVRYDLARGLFGEEASIPPFLEAGRPLEKDNFAPRLGAAFSVNDGTVIRGGFGQYFGEVTGIGSLFAKVFAGVFQANIFNDGRPDFAANPWNGPVPTLDEVTARWRAGEFPRRLQVALPSADSKRPYSWQGSVGVQRQLGTTMAFTADYVFVGERKNGFTRNTNLSYNPATGVNFPFTDIARKPFPEFAEVNQVYTDAWSNSHALQTGFTKRFSARWQAQGTYTLSKTFLGFPLPVPTAFGCKHPWSGPGVCDVPINNLARDLGGDSYWTDWESRAVLNGIWDMGYGFQLSGLYFYRNGVRIQSSWGGDLRRTGASGSTGSPVGRLRPDGTIVPRNNLPTKSLHRMDLGLQRRFQIAGRARITGIVEVFNVLNHENFGSYVTTEASRNFGQPSFNGDIAYAPRQMQLGFRFEF